MQAVLLKSYLITKEITKIIPYCLLVLKYGKPQFQSLGNLDWNSKAVHIKKVCNYYKTKSNYLLRKCMSVVNTDDCTTSMTIYISMYSGHNSVLILLIIGGIKQSHNLWHFASNDIKGTITNKFCIEI